METMTTIGTERTRGEPRDTRAAWAIYPEGTVVTVEATNMFVLTVRARFADVTGRLVLDDGDMRRSSVEATVRADSITTGLPPRDMHLRTGMFLAAKRAPLITFTSTRVEEVGRDHLRITGDLTLRGTTRPVALDATVEGRDVDERGRAVARYSATAVIDRRDFGIRVPRLLVGRMLTLTARIQAVAQQ